MPEQASDIAVLKHQVATEDERIRRAEDIILQQQSLLASLAAQISAMNDNVSLLNHNIRQTCDRLDAMVLQGHQARIEAVELWCAEMDQWRGSLYGKVLGLMGFGLAAAVAMGGFAGWLMRTF